ncbi:MAG: hypothetical protein NXH73_07915 [Flavobacteriaceae bacterium]|nr:hypothetical protein [Flavobacteriaceae bacterium]
MSRIKLHTKINWPEKVIDFLIVIFGITIAFQLNNWNEIRKSELKERNYIQSFYEENIDNETNLNNALSFSLSNKKNIDTLIHIIQSKNYSDRRIQTLLQSMLQISNFTPITTTMENITSSGEFELIKDIDLRKEIINSYNTHNTTLKLEGLLLDHLNDYVIPFYFENIRFADSHPLDKDLINTPLFENIVFGYSVLLNQQIEGYRNNLEKIISLKGKLDKYR